MRLMIGRYCSGTCNRLRHDCEYPERRRNLGSKRRNMKELEARLGMPQCIFPIRTTLIFNSSSRNTTRLRTKQSSYNTGHNKYEYGSRLE